uniref:Amino acid:DNA transferase domain-containing protein n=1 Tax=Pseudomonas phage Cygsa01 TaxID=3138529 RepID=A0AAU6W329_9VIRU
MRAIEKQYKHPALSEFIYPIEKGVDYRLKENRAHLAMAWQETLCYTEEHNQQLRLMLWAINNQDISTTRATEQKLWCAFLWGCCYNLIGPWAIMQEYPEPPRGKDGLQRFADWYNKNFDRMRFDTDCRYRKSKMIACVTSYVEWLNGREQFEAFAPILREPHSKVQFERLWETCNSWKFFGRLSNWNTIEAIELATDHDYKIDIPSFMLTDVSGSESNRNGAAFLAGYDELVTKHGKLKTTGETISQADCEKLEVLAEMYFQQAKADLGHLSYINRLNAETSIFCWFKKFFRLKSTRYVGWDGERTYEELEYMRREWPEANLEPLWEARYALLPDFLLCECAPQGEQRGVNKAKMPLFYETGFPEHIYRFQRGERWAFPEEGVAKSTKPAKSPAQIAAAPATTNDLMGFFQ